VGASFQLARQLKKLVATGAFSLMDYSQAFIERKSSGGPETCPARGVPEKFFSLTPDSANPFALGESICIDRPSHLIEYRYR
jgi:hypothetical protein